MLRANTAHVPTKLQKKIQAGKYVEMGKLYRPDTPQSQVQIVAKKFPLSQRTVKFTHSHDF